MHEAVAKAIKDSQPKKCQKGDLQRIQNLTNLKSYIQCQNGEQINDTLTPKGCSQCQSLFGSLKAIPCCYLDNDNKVIIKNQILLKKQNCNGETKELNTCLEHSIYNVNECTSVELDEMDYYINHSQEGQECMKEMNHALSISGTSYTTTSCTKCQEFFKSSSNFSECYMKIEGGNHVRVSAELLSMKDICTKVLDTKENSVKSVYSNMTLKELNKHIQSKRIK